jgi:transposase-like protein
VGRVSEWLAERGVLVDQSTIFAVGHFLPLFGEVARKYRQPVGPDWRVDETYARIGGHWRYLYRAIDGHGQIVDAYVSPTRDTIAARRFFERAIASSATTPRRVITDKAATYPLALGAAVPGVLHRTGRYRTNGLERDHGFLKNGCGRCVASSPLLQRRSSWSVTSCCATSDVSSTGSRVSSPAAGLCLDLEPAGRSGLIPFRKEILGDRSVSWEAVGVALQPPRRCKRTAEITINPLGRRL